MNIFYLSENPQECAEFHCNKHCVKMIIEYAQLMSTAHRILDGQEYLDQTANGRKIKRWRLQDNRESQLYKASHINHPSAIWVRQSEQNYNWLYKLFVHLCLEYTYRYGKTHATAMKLTSVLSQPPKNIPKGGMTPVPQAMPDDVKVKNNSIQAYKNYYIKYKKDFALYKNRSIPQWLTPSIQQ